MGQKVNPYGFRLGVTTDWKSRWFSEREYKDYLTEDWKIRDYISTSLADAAISRIEVERKRGEKDGRLVTVELTPSGKRLMKKLFPEFNKAERHVIRDLAPAEQSVAADILRRITQASN